MFLVLIVKALGADKILCVAAGAKSQAMGQELGADYIIPLPTQDKKQESYQHDEEVVKKILEHTDGMGVDVAFEMAGPNSSVNNTLASVRRGGDVILFGLKSGDFVIENFDRIIINGLTLYGIIGRHVFGTWEITKKLLEDKDKNIQEKIFNVILQGGKDTIMDIKDFTPQAFEKKMSDHPKFLLKLT